MASFGGAARAAGAAAAGAASGPGGNFPDGKHTIIGIDLGTAYSGISFMMRADPGIVNASSPKSPPNQHKEPTVMLRAQNGGWLFGTDALEYFNRCVAEDNEEDDLARCTRVANVRLYKTFKFDLLRCDGADEFHEVAVSAKNTAAQNALLEVYAECLKKLKEYALNCVNRELGRTPALNEILWVLTVPAKMNDWAKGFMREAACRGGLTTRETRDSSNDLMILLEPEAAAIAIAHTQNTPPTGIPGPAPAAAPTDFFAVGQRFLILDCGGGTVDITSHEVTRTSPLTMRSLTMVGGGDYGSEQVNLNFENFLKGLLRQVSPTFEAELRGKRAGNFQTVLRDFDTIKVAARPQSETEPERISLRDLLETSENISAFSAIVERFNASSAVKISKFAKNAALTLSKELVLSFFEPMLTEIVRCTREVIAESRQRNTPVRCIAVVGGFAASEVLRARLDREFGTGDSRMPLVYPSTRLHPQAAVVVGAARGGCLARLPAPAAPGGGGGGAAAGGAAAVGGGGAGLLNRFASSTYGVFYEPDTFRVLVTKGEDVAVGHTKDLVGYPVNLQQDQCVWKIYASDKTNPTSCLTERFLGSVTVKVPLVGNIKEREMRARFHFGTADIRVVIRTQTGEKEETIRFDRGF